MGLGYDIFQTVQGLMLEKVGQSRHSDGQIDINTSPKGYDSAQGKRFSFF